MCVGSALFAQNQEEDVKTRPLNSIYTNLLGDASLISVNYERLYSLSPTFILSSKVGLGYNIDFQLCLFGTCPPPKEYLIIPHHITGNIGERRVFFEFGLGGSLILGETTQPYLMYPIVGYRIHPLKSNRVNFRIFAQIPLTKGFIIDDILFSPVGVSLGLSF